MSSATNLLEIEQTVDGSGGLAENLLSTLVFRSHLRRTLLSVLSVVQCSSVV